MTHDSLPKIFLTSCKGYFQLHPIHQNLVTELSPAARKCRKLLSFSGQICVWVKIKILTNEEEMIVREIEG